MDKTVEKIIYDLANKMNQIFPLYHGTDARIVQMSDNERSNFRHSCEIASAYLWQILNPYIEKYGFSLDIFKEPLSTNQTCYRNLLNAVTCYSASINGNIQYQYGDAFYLTNMRDMAERYAYRSFAFGETGLLPYRMYDAVRQLNLKEWNPSEEVSKAIDDIVAFAEDRNHVSPVIFDFNNLDFNLIEIERYGSVFDYVTNGLFSRNIGIIVHYKGKTNLNLSKAIYLK